MRPASALVVAKSPIVGKAKTRLGREVGMERAADLAAAALLDTLAVCASAYGVERCQLAVDGLLAHGQLADELLEATADWAVHPQRGDGLAERLVNAHTDAASFSGAPVVQVGMDTPQLTPWCTDRGRDTIDGAGRGRPRAGARRRLVAARPRWATPVGAPR